MQSALKELVIEAEDNVDLYQAPRDAISQVYKNPCAQGCYKSLNVFVVAAPCHGFGDVVFASKFARYLKHGLTAHSQPYSTKVTIVTPAPKMFEQLGTKDIKVVGLTGGHLQCRRLQAYNRPKGLGVADLIFVAPLANNFEISYADAKKLFKESNPFNTIFVSEYQDDPKKRFDFLTGIGAEYDGLLFDGAKPDPKLKQLGTTPYALAYIAKDVGIKSCLSNFVKMIAAKYHKKYPTLQVVMPEWGAEQLFANKAFKKAIAKQYPKLLIVRKGDPKPKMEKGQLILRADILPVVRTGMLSLIKHSISDILVTGDQSVTDVIDCCQKKNIWYQTVPWKTELAKELAKELPQKYLANARTSCGTIKAIKWNNKGTNFKSRNDFRKKAKHELDAIFRAASEARKKTSVVSKYLDQLKKSKSKKLLLQVLE